MGLGNFGQKLVASAKLSSMEKYGWAYMEDYLIVKESMKPDIQIEELGNGNIRVTFNGRTFDVVIRDWAGKSMENAGKPKVIAGERNEEWVSIWDVNKH